MKRKAENPKLTNYINGRKDEEFIENPKPNVICTEADILMTRTGSTGRLITGVAGVFHNNFFKVDWKKEILNKTFLVHYLSSPGIKRELLKRASTTTIPDLNHSEFYKIKIPIPQFEDQNRFAYIIEQIETQKQLTQQSLKKSEELFQGLLQKAFKGEL